MRHTASFAMTDEAEVARLIRENPWVTMVSTTDAGEQVASHYPVILDEGADGLVILSHVGRPDEILHELGRHELLVIVQGPHGYISSSWYDAAPAVPTWNFIVAHLYGTPELLPEAENLAVLERLVDRFESTMPEPRAMNGTLADGAYAARIVSGTVGFRMRVDRFTAKDKMSQNRSPETVQRIIDVVESDNPGLAREMRRARDRPSTTVDR